jgi:PAS domain S-box-containing protein
MTTTLRYYVLNYVLSYVVFRKDRPLDLHTETPQVDYRAAFDFAPIGLALSRHRHMVDCNAALCDMFGVSREQIVGQSFAVLYPSVAEYERTGARIAPLLGRSGRYADDRLMKRADGQHGRNAGELFWCHVTGRALNRAQPHEAGIWSFEDLSATRVVKADLTPREREVAAYLLEGLTSKQIGKCLDISHRTVEIYRARLMRKYQAHSAADLVHKLMAG